jgi:predicted nucleic acid-binding protein
MTKFLLDSDIIIWHLRGRKEITEMLRDLQRIGLPGCSAISVIEVQLGVRTEDEEEKTSHFLGSLNVFDINLEIANKAARLIREYKAKGVTIDIPDAIIASTCLLHTLVLVTYNRKHYPISELEFHPLPPIKA